MGRIVEVLEILRESWLKVRRGNCGEILRLIWHQKRVSRFFAVGLALAGAASFLGLLLHFIQEAFSLL